MVCKKTGELLTELGDLSAADETFPLSHGPWVQKNSRQVYENPWINLEHHDVITPGGGDGIYGLIHFKNQAVGIIPIDTQGNTWLVKQYRYALGVDTWEIPMGGSPIGEDVLLTAQRELVEETGLKAETWRSLGMAHLSNSVTDEEGYLFVAQGITQGASYLEDSEADIVVKKLPLQEAIAMAEDGRITDVLSVLGLLKVKLLGYV